MVVGAVIIAVSAVVAFVAGRRAAAHGAADARSRTRGHAGTRLVSAPPASGLLSVEAARDAVLAVTDPVGAEPIAPPMPSGGSPPRLSSGASRSRRGRTRRWTAMRSGPPIPPSRRRNAPVELRVIGDIAAGAAPDVTIEPGTAARIATGARLPDGADAVVPVEPTTPLDAAGRPGPRGRDATGPVPGACLVHEPVAPGGSIRAEGSDLKAGTTLLQAGTAITAAAVTLSAGAGVEQILVHRRPRIAVLATGDEVRAPGRAARPSRDPRRQRPRPSRARDRRRRRGRSTSASRPTTSTTSWPGSGPPSPTAPTP